MKIIQISNKKKKKKKNKTKTKQKGKNKINIKHLETKINKKKLTQKEKKLKKKYPEASPKDETSPEASPVIGSWSVAIWRHRRLNRRDWELKRRRQAEASWLCLNRREGELSRRMSRRWQAETTATTEGEASLESWSVAGAKEGEVSPTTWTVGIGVRTVGIGV